MAMTCPNCGTNLDDVPPEEHCPTCGSPGRDATIYLDPNDMSVAIAQAQAVTTSMAVDAFIALLPNKATRPPEDLALGTTVRTVVFHDPGEGGAVLCEARDADGKILDAK